MLNWSLRGASWGDSCLSESWLSELQAEPGRAGGIKPYSWTGNVPGEADKVKNVLSALLNRPEHRNWLENGWKDEDILLKHTDLWAQLSAFDSQFPFSLLFLSSFNQCSRVLSVCGRWPACFQLHVKSEMNVTCFPFRCSSCSSFTNDLLQAADESKCSQRWDNCRYTHIQCVCVCVLGICRPCGSLFFIVSSAIISRLLWKHNTHTDKKFPNTWLVNTFSGWNYCGKPVILFIPATHPPAPAHPRPSPYLPPLQVISNSSVPQMGEHEKVSHVEQSTQSSQISEQHADQ